MFERFTDRSRRVVVLAQEEARLLKHDHIGTEHILLGLINEGEGVAARALRQGGLDLDTVRTEVEARIGVGTRHQPGGIPFTPRAKKVLELSLREALQLKHNYIGTEHILLGLIHEGEGVAAQVLAGRGLDLELVRGQVLEILREQPDHAEQHLSPNVLQALQSRVDLQHALLLKLEAGVDSINRRLDAMGVPADPAERRNEGLG